MGAKPMDGGSNAKSFPGCGRGDNEQKVCSFGGDVQHYATGQQFIYASSEGQNLKKGDVVFSLYRTVFQYGH